MLVLRPTVALILFVFLNISYGFAQKKSKSTLVLSPKQQIQYDNREYLEQIKTVQFHPKGKEQEIPVYTLGSNETFEVSFDDLRADNRNLYYSIEHCNADWTPSRLAVMDYVQSLNEDRISDQKMSVGTLKPYTHYRFQFPNEYISPKIAGNYILKVYEDANADRLLLTRRFYIVKPILQISAECTFSPETQKRESYQKLNITINSPISITNPQRELKILVMQNQRSDMQFWTQTPTVIQPYKLIYNTPTLFDIVGNNEFRLLDMRSMKSAGTQVEAIYTDSTHHVKLFADFANKQQMYKNSADNNGLFIIQNLDFENPEITGDYAQVLFTLDAPQNIAGDIYVVGLFNNYNLTNKLTFNPILNKYETSILLKQGIYNYEYILSEDKTTRSDYFSGSHFQTRNDYQFFVYYRRPGTFWEEIIGFNQTEVNTSKTQN